MQLKSRGFVFRVTNVLSILFTPGYSYCDRCHGRWNIVERHSTRFNEHSGLFPLCEECWRALTPEERWPYYQRLLMEWNCAPGDIKWMQVHDAVRHGG